MSTEEAKAVRPRNFANFRRLLKLKMVMERREPVWMRIDEWRYVRIQGKGWRRPRGLDNKIRLQIKGKPKLVKVGYRKPRLVRGLHPTGFKEVLVHRVEDLDGLDPEVHAVRIARGVGRRKRLEILREALRRGLKVLNPGKEALEASGKELKPAEGA